MNIQELLKDKGLIPKEKTETLSNWIRNGEVSIEEIVSFASTSKDTIKATCIESMEFVTQKHPELFTQNGFEFVTNQLLSKAPRVKWESAKVIGNTCKLFLDNLDQAIAHVLLNTQHEGTVVRWSAAFALGEILKLKTKHNASLLPQIEEITRREEKNSIIKIYQNALKKMN